MMTARSFCLLFAAGLAQIHEHRDERGLSVGGQQGHHLILDGLDAAADLLPQALLHDGVDLLLRHGDAHGRRISSRTLAADLLAAHLNEGGQVGQRRWTGRRTGCEATWATIWVAMLQAVAKLWGFSMSVPVMTVPFCSMSSRFTRSQLCMCWA